MGPDDLQDHLSLIIFIPLHHQNCKGGPVLVAICEIVSPNLAQESHLLVKALALQNSLPQGLDSPVNFPDGLEDLAFSELGTYGLL